VRPLCFGAEVFRVCELCDAQACGQLGARLAIGHGAAWVRWVFVTVVAALLALMAWQLIAET